jgi:hypothetical protein
MSEVYMVMSAVGFYIYIYIHVYLSRKMTIQIHGEVRGDRTRCGAVGTNLL